MDKLKITKREAVAATNALKQLGNMQIEDRTAYWLGRNLTNLGRIEKDVMKKRSEIIKRFGKEDPKTGKVQIPQIIGAGEDEKLNPDLKTAEEEFNKILDEEIEVEIMKVNVSGFGKANVALMVAINFMVEEPQAATIVRVK